MESIKEQQADWIRHRQRLEQECRVLVVDGEDNTRRQLDELLFRCHIPARAVGTAKQALTLVGREHYSLMVVADVMPGMRGLALTRQVRVSHPDVDVLLTAWEPSLELLSQAFDLRLLDVLVKPFDDADELADTMRRAVRRHVDRRMRVYLLNELRKTLELLDPDSRLRTISALDRRLAAFKSALGSAAQVLVVEATGEQRSLSENLLLAGMSVETTEYLDEALRRVDEGDVLLLAVGTPLDEHRLGQLLRKLHDVDPYIELAVVAVSPTVDQAMLALRNEVAAYIPWPPLSSITAVAASLRDILRRGRQARLVDNLFVELYRETTRALGEPAAARDEAFASYRRLIGLERMTATQLERFDEPDGDGEGPDVAKEIAERSKADQLDVIRQLDEALSDILDDLDGRAAALTPGESSHERRTHARVPDNQFVRFRKRSASSAVLAYLGDLSEGGVFIRTASLLSVGDVIEVDIDAEYQQSRYLVCCRGEVAWIARDERASPMAPGFGVRFVEPPVDVVTLLRKMVRARQQEQAAAAEEGSAG